MGNSTSLAFRGRKKEKKKRRKTLWEISNWLRFQPTVCFARGKSSSAGWGVWFHLVSWCHGAIPACLQAVLAVPKGRGTQLGLGRTTPCTLHLALAVAAAGSPEQRHSIPLGTHSSGAATSLHCWRGEVSLNTAPSPANSLQVQLPCWEGSGVGPGDVFVAEKRPSFSRGLSWRSHQLLPLFS